MRALTADRVRWWRWAACGCLALLLGGPAPERPLDDRRVAILEHGETAHFRTRG